ncbi:MAG TPA: family 1 encapsulin nanocompartment shell protein [Acidimicrobiia bacterium]|nr:family 1 encapsulin nanocompartment shell protein [Acidimicrobiia bacterium]
MNHLLRSYAPISDTGWSAIDQEVHQRLVPGLAARRLVDFSGPAGWEHSAVDLGRVTDIDAPAKGLRASQRRVMPLVELRAGFTVSRAELRDLDRGAVDTDFSSVDTAARRIAEAENVAVFHGWASAGIVGISQAAEIAPIAPGKKFADYPKHVAKAVEMLLSAGVSGPYGLALSPDSYTGVVETEHGGLVVFDHLREILDGPIVWAPGVVGAIVVSLRGGDFLFESGEDLSVGYDHHDADNVHLYIEESFTFRVATPEAAVVLKP